MDCMITDLKKRDNATMVAPTSMQIEEIKRLASKYGESLDMDRVRSKAAAALIIDDIKLRNEGKKTANPSSLRYLNALWLEKLKVCRPDIPLTAKKCSDMISSLLGETGKRNFPVYTRADFTLDQLKEQDIVIDLTGDSDVEHIDLTGNKEDNPAKKAKVTGDD